MNKIPYFELFELKVVKAKKERESPSCGDCSNYDTFCKQHCSYYKNHIKKLKGTWVNGENLDKIKFPVPCSYIDTEDRKRHIGMPNCYVDQYRLYNMEKQSEDNFVDDCTSLGNLIKSYDIHILKGKLIIFEEEE